MRSPDDAKPTPPFIRHSDGRVQRGHVHEGGDLTLPLAGGTIDQCCIDHALTLHVHVDQSPWSIRIEGVFTLAQPGEEPQELSIHEGVTPGGVNLPINLLLHRSVRTATVRASGGLSLVFDDGTELEVLPGGPYEAWNVNGPDGAIWVGGVSGAVSVFDGLK